MNPTGLTGGRVACQEGPRQTLDCRGAIQQYARDFKLDLSGLSKVQVGLGSTSSKLTEADALTGDLVQHYYQTCALYNACLISQHEYVARTEKLQEIQLAVRQALVASGYGSQQNIQINPPAGETPGVSSPEGAARPPRGPAVSQQASEETPAQTAPGGGKVANAPPPASKDPLDTVLNILREGASLVRVQKSPAGQTPVPPGSAVSAEKRAAADAQPAGAQSDLDSSLRAMLVSLKQDIARRNAALASARAVVGNFTEEGQPWSGPLGAVLRDRIAALVGTGALFRPAAETQTRGITIKQVAVAQDPNDPKAAAALHSSDLAITGTYRPASDGVAVQLTAFDAAGQQLAQTGKTLSTQTLPEGVALRPANGANASDLLQSLNRLGPKSQGGARVDITTNRPGTGASFRQGEAIRYFVRSTREGYLYLFHVDADQQLLRIYPNQFQRDATIGAGSILEVPAPGAAFSFEASPPFGLETTFAIVTGVPLDDKDFQFIENGFAKPKQEVPALVASRGLRATRETQTGASSAPEGAAPAVTWNAVTVLIRP